MPVAQLTQRKARPKWWNSDCWATPREIVDTLEQEFGRFDLDPCCHRSTAKARRFYTAADDGLAKPWRGRVFLNPPYSKPGPWLEKARREVADGRAELVVALVPASVDTRWFHEQVQGHAEVRFRRGRIRFIGWQGTPIGSPKQPSMFAIYRRRASSAAA